MNTNNIEQLFSDAYTKIRKDQAYSSCGDGLLSFLSSAPAVPWSKLRGPGYTRKAAKRS